jgi:soluble lytic murein transglycosylase
MLPNLYAYGQAGGLACLLVLGVSSQDVMGEPIYQYKDKDRVMHFSNVPTDPRYRTVIATDRVQDSDAPAVASQPVAALSSQLNETSASRSGDSVYQYVDRNGLIHFTNVPTNPRYKKIRGPRAFTQLQPKRLSPALHQTITQTSLVYRMNPALVRAVIQAESAYDPDAVSPKGAMGLMQLMPEMAWSLNVANPYDPKQNITGGVRHLRYLLDRFGGNLELALAAYHAGETRVSRESRIPRISETQQYVRKVIRFYQSFSRDGGRSDRLYATEAQSLVTRRFVNLLSPN